MSEGLALRHLVQVAFVDVQLRHAGHLLGGHHAELHALAANDSHSQLGSGF